MRTPGCRVWISRLDWMLRAITRRNGWTSMTRIQHAISPMWTDDCTYSIGTGVEETQCVSCIGIRCKLGQMGTWDWYVQGSAEVKAPLGFLRGVGGGGHVSCSHLSVGCVYSKHLPYNSGPCPPGGPGASADVWGTVFTHRISTDCFYKISSGKEEEAGASKG